MHSFKKKGIVLLLVLGSILIVLSLAAIIIGIIASHSRLTQHQISRTQAYYAGMAGLNYALEKLHLPPPPPASNVGWTLNSCPNDNPCTISDTWPRSIRSVKVVFCPSGPCPAATDASHPCKPPPGTNFCVYSVVDYTYTPDYN